MKKEIITEFLHDNKIVILGFGKEGISSYRFIRKHFPDMPLVVADRNRALDISKYSDDEHLSFILGEHYDNNLNDFDLILKTPGVNLNHLSYFIPPSKISSQTDLFIKGYGDQIIGVTGTKGKSTTSSLIYYILKNVTDNAILSGNIGIPFFDVIDSINENTIVVAELSAHQLEYTNHSPKVAVFLNLFQEHLDHFNSFSNYQLAKLNITQFQGNKDYLIYNADDEHIQALLKSHRYERNVLPYSRKNILSNGAYSYESKIVIAEQKEVISEFELKEFSNLPGRHNYYNIMAAILACKTKNIDDESITKYLKTFKGLPHRLEYIGTHNDILFYNDSISTIPEAAIAALKTLRKVDTLILGGFDRGIEYDSLIDYIHEYPLSNVAFTGPAGKRIFDEWKEKYPLPSHFILENDFHEIVLFAYKYTQKGKICLLSPAAASYDQFKNFTERGDFYKSLVINNILKVNDSNL